MLKKQTSELPRYLMAPTHFAELNIQAAHLTVSLQKKQPVIYMHSEGSPTHCLLIFLSSSVLCITVWMNQCTTTREKGRITCSLSSWFVWVVDRCLNSWVSLKQCLTCSGDTKSSATLIQLYRLCTWVGQSKEWTNMFVKQGTKMKV